MAAQQIAEAFGGIARRVISYMIEIAFKAQHSVSELGKSSWSRADRYFGAPPSR
jgi:hypothetical protein